MEITNKEKRRLWLQELEDLDDKRLQAQQQIKLYQAWIFRAFNKKVKERTFKKGNLVLAVRRPWWWHIRQKENSSPNKKDHL